MVKIPGATGNADGRETTPTPSYPGAFPQLWTMYRANSTDFALPTQIN